MKITKQQLERLIKEEMENTLQEKYKALLSGSETLLTKWQPKTSEGKLYKKQLHELLSKVKSQPIVISMEGEGTINELNKTTT